MMGRGLLQQLEKANKLDRLTDPIQRRVQGILRGRVRDLLHGGWLGHPLHPVLIQVPTGAWLSAAIADAVPGMGSCATVLVGVGTAGALPAVVAGWNDWSELPAAQRRVGLVHAVTNGVGIGLYTASLVARLTGNQRLGRRLGYAGLGTISVGAFLGGHLTYRFAAGVNQAAPLENQIPEGWHDLCEFAVLGREQRMVAHIGDIPVLVSRSGDTVSAMIERCGHETGPLGDGEFTTINGADCVVCPWHGSTFRLTDGAVMHGPAATDQPMLRTRIRNGCVQASLP
jgi:nitrite reductase/ring-hydroxylating ferredoxin subunit